MMKTDYTHYNDCSICQKPVEPFTDTEIYYLQNDEFLYDKIHIKCLDHKLAQEQQIWKMNQKKQGGLKTPLSLRENELP